MNERTTKTTNKTGNTEAQVSTQPGCFATLFSVVSSTAPPVSALILAILARRAGASLKRSRHQIIPETSVAIARTRANMLAMHTPYNSIKDLFIAVFAHMENGQERFLR